MDFSQVLSAANSLSIDDRIRLVEAIWESIEGEPPMPELTEAQKQELDRRLAAYEAAPRECVPWEQVEAEARARLRR
jgi:putative addiction module component (TIGR02574 family)